MEHQQGISYQLDLFTEQNQNDIRFFDNREYVNRAETRKERQVNGEGIQGIETWQAWIASLSGKGLWRKSSFPQMHRAMNNSWFEGQKLFNLSLNYEKFNYLLKPPSARACLVV